MMAYRARVLTVIVITLHRVPTIKDCIAVTGALLAMAVTHTYNNILNLNMMSRIDEQQAKEMASRRGRNSETTGMRRCSKDGFL